MTALMLEPQLAALPDLARQLIAESRRVSYGAWQRIAASYHRVAAYRPIAGASQGLDGGADGDREAVAALAARFNAAALAGTACTIVYREEGRAGTTHSVEPIAATSRVLRARDVFTRQVKVFLLAWVEIQSDGAAVVAAPLPLGGRGRTDRELLAAAAGELRAQGWHAVASSKGVSVYRIDGEGTPLRIATASIVRRERSRDGTRGPGLERPWTVVVRGTPDARAFATLESAIAFFVNEARARAPRWRPIPTPPAP